MAYTRTNWQNEVTPLDANNLNNIEDGVEAAQVDSDVITQYTALGVVFDDALRKTATLDDDEDLKK